MDMPESVLGHRLLRPVGRGGQSVVYEARGPGGARRAVKILTLARAEGFREAELFERGARVLQGLSHPFLPAVHGFEATDDGELRLVTEYFEGGSLEERVEGGWHATPAEIRALLAHLLGLLDFLHRRAPPILHRDIKPSNLLFRHAADDLPALVDFDVVALPAEDRSGLTIVGTPGYAAPEQFAGEATERSDLYGVGASVLYAATHVPPARLPRRGGRLAIGDRLEALDEATRRVLLALVEPRAEDRPASAREALARLAGAAPAAAERAGRARARVMVLVAATGLLVAVGAGAAAWLAAEGAETAATAPRTAPIAASPRAEAEAPPPRPPRAAEPPAEAEAAAPAPATPPVAAPGPARIRLLSEPAGATVWHGDRRLGETPLEIDRPEGGLLLLTREGFQTAEIDLDRVPAGGFTSETTLAARAAGGPGAGALAVSAVLDDARPRFLGCAQHLPDSVEGPVTFQVRFYVRAGGKTRGARVVDPPLGTGEAARCVTEAIGALRFPRGYATSVDTPIRVR